MIGDILDDVEAGNRAGCRTVLVDLGTEPVSDRPERQPSLVAPSTSAALREIAAREGLPLAGPPPSPYQPPRWSHALTVRS
jgi:D-glycero-D-manno-heptose 1,7-bisphosphate phosphatase